VAADPLECDERSFGANMHTCAYVSSKHSEHVCMYILFCFYIKFVIYDYLNIGEAISINTENCVPSSLLHQKQHRAWRPDEFAGIIAHNVAQPIHCHIYYKTFSVQKLAQNFGLHPSI
jgi:hypothetical protein